MPIEVGIWKLGQKPQRVNFTPLDSEEKLEDVLCQDLSILSPQLMLIGRQIPTDYGTAIDILAMDVEGNLTVIELKRDRTPREVVAQVLDYASWIQNLSYERIAEIYAEKNPGKHLEEGFANYFQATPPEKLNQSHNLIVVASELDPATERIIDYLADSFGVPINAVFFRYFKDGGNEYLTRSWLIDPQEAEFKTSKAASKKQQEVWNGRDFYVSFGEGSNRSWEDACKYGFISGGRGKWYSQTLSLLFPGARVFVNIPQCGYVGVGIVKETVKPINEFTVTDDGKEIPILKAPLHANAKDMGEFADDPEMREYLVRVEWLKTVPIDDAHWEKGLFAVQHTTCRMRNRFTIDRLVAHFGLTD
ncbi:MAG: DUF91 domain-containing protein [Planctomycetes bacterium]|nr:DUF91 domain-containing protein [Planctomycetota bacterium]